MSCDSSQSPRALAIALGDVSTREACSHRNERHRGARRRVDQDPTKTLYRLVPTKAELFQPSPLFLDVDHKLAACRAIVEQAISAHDSLQREHMRVQQRNKLA